MQRKSVSILGVTGSIGQSTADVILSAPEMFDVCTVTANQDEQGLEAAVARLGARHSVLGAEGLDECIQPGTDLTVAAIGGFAGLKPLMNAIENSEVVAIANKEPLVAAGHIVMAHAKKHNCKILPIDSEHNAIFQVFDAAQKDAIKRIILTASGGPFRTWSAEEIAGASLEQALKHPNWDMGQKITIDSATMMNKGLEVIEAHILFDMPLEQIDVVIHPQSVVHSMVEYNDGSILAQMGASDMRTPIAYALGWPDRLATPGKTLDLTSMARLDFEAPDEVRFPALRLAYEALRAGGYACVALNAANEVAVDGFLKKQIGFGDIMRVVENVMQGAEENSLSGLDDVLHLDHIYRSKAKSVMTAL